MSRTGMGKRLLAMLAAAVMAASLASCADGGNTSGDTSKSPSASGGESGIGERAPDLKYEGKENPYADLNLNGESIKIGAGWSIEPAEDGSSTAATLQWERIRYLEEKYNCKFEFVMLDGAETSERIRASVASGAPYVDALIMYTNEIPSYAMNGYLQNLDELTSFDLSDPKWNSGALQMGTLNNKHYSFSLGNYIPRYVIAFNKTMFERNGWESPYDLYKNGQWTWNKLIELAQKATDTASGRYGFTGSTILQGSVFASFGGAVVSLDENGVPSFTGDSENCVQAVQLLKDLKDKYNVMWTPETSTWEVYINALADGTVAMAPTQLYLIRENILDMEDDYGIVPVPKSDTADGKYASIADDVPTYVMLANNPLAQEKAYILDLFTEPYAGYEDILSRSELETYCRDEESVEILLEVEKNYITFDYAIWFPKASQDYNAAVASALDGTATFAEAIGKSKNQIVQSISDVYASWQE